MKLDLVLNFPLCVIVAVATNIVIVVSFVANERDIVRRMSTMFQEKSGSENAKKKRRKDNVSVEDIVSQYRTSFLS